MAVHNRHSAQKSPLRQKQYGQQRHGQQQRHPSRSQARKASATICGIPRAIIPVAAMLIIVVITFQNQHQLNESQSLFKQPSVAHPRPSLHDSHNADNADNNKLRGMALPPPDSAAADDLSHNKSKQAESEDENGDWVNITIDRHHGTIQELMAVFDCEDDPGFQNRAIPTRDDWITMRKAYEFAVGQNRSSLPDDIEGEGAKVPYYIDIHPTMNRGLFAKEFIAKGTLIWTYDYVALFETPEDFRVFLLNLPPQFVCYMFDVWTYATYRDPKTLIVHAELDASSLLNQAAGIRFVNVADLPYNESGEANDTALFATRDIEAGEQFMIAYTKMWHINWKTFGMAPRRNHRSNSTNTTTAMINATADAVVTIS